MIDAVLCCLVNLDNFALSLEHKKSEEKKLLEVSLYLSQHLTEDKRNCRFSIAQ